MKMNKVILELTRTEANTLEAMIQTNLETSFTEEAFTQILNIENEEKRTDECNLFLIAKFVLEKIRDELKAKKEERHNKAIKATNDIVSIVESMLNNKEENKENK